MRHSKINLETIIKYTFLAGLLILVVLMLIHSFNTNDAFLFKA